MGSGGYSAQYGIPVSVWKGRHGGPDSGRTPVTKSVMGEFLEFPWADQHREIYTTTSQGSGCQR